MTEPKPTVTIQLTHDNYKIGLTLEQARELWEGLNAIFSGADHYFWPAGAITTSGGKK